MKLDLIWYCINIQQTHLRVIHLMMHKFTSSMFCLFPPGMKANILIWSLPNPLNARKEPCNITLRMLIWRWKRCQVWKDALQILLIKDQYAGLDPDIIFPILLTYFGLFARGHFTHRLWGWFYNFYTLSSITFSRFWDEQTLRNIRQLVLEKKNSNWKLKYILHIS